jgi:starvation-inducible DNA-binding protein
MKINIGIDEKDRREIAEGLSRLLADNYALYVKTQSFHWNVTGPLFETLHLMFERQYKDLAEANDELAERIRALGFPVRATLQEFEELSEIGEDRGVPPAEKMIQLLVEGHETATRTGRGILDTAAKANDQPTVDLVTERMEAHEKAAWMLRSMLEGVPAAASAGGKRGAA